MLLGNLLLWLAMFTTLAATAAYIIAGITGRRMPELVSLGRSAYYAMTTTTIGVSIYLMSLILGDKFQYQYVTGYSAKSQEFIYKISAFWAGQEGSFLLWALFGALLGLLLIRKAGEYESWLMAFWSLIQAFFFTLLLIRSPFVLIDGWMPGMDGSGMNPLLKNPWMAIHPPLVFLGYAAMAIPAAFVVTALIKKDYSSWANRCLPWTIFAWVSLGAGIFIGGFWAYEVLGWGGYWGWDPVENASLIPWLTGTALLHGMLVERSRGTLKRTNMVMAIISFLLIIYATFLTRSGVLGEFSVHSFSDLGVNGWLIAFMIGFTVISFGLYALRARQIPGGPAFTNTASKEFIFFLTLLVLSASTILIFIGTSSPILTGWWVKLFHSGGKASAVQPEFYVLTNTPIAVALAALLSLAPVMAWSIRREGASSEGSQRRSKTVGNLLLAAAAVAVAGGFAFGFKDHKLAQIAAAIALGLFSLIALIVNGMRIVEVRRNWKLIGGFLAHFGVGLMFIGIIFSNRGITTTLLLPENGKAQASHGYSFQYIGLDEKGPDKADVKIKVSKGNDSFIARPTMQSTRDGIMRSPFIKVRPVSDLYIAPEELSVIGRETVTPVMQIGKQGNKISPAAKIPGTNVQVKLLGMQVEGRMAQLEVLEPGKEPEFIEVAERSPAVVGGRRIEFGGFSAPKGHGTSEAAFGVNLTITDENAQTAARIKVSDKPLISVLWAGLILILLGGTIAIFRRTEENRKILKDGVVDEEILEEDLGLRT